MADTAHKDEESKREYFDSPEELEKKVDMLVEWIRESRSTNCFTGAGVSTAAGIPDFRSGMGTKLKVGPGVWELRAKKKARSKKAKTIASTLQAIPTTTHMALVALHEAGYLHSLTSQNTDGLHLRSGFPVEKLAELHGNSNLETCSKCGARYLRDFKVRRAGNRVHDHDTGRKCRCGGKLEDSIINFGETLPDGEWDKADRWSEEADLCIAAGSSLTVTPAANLPEAVGRRRDSRLVIINLQPTPLDKHASLRIHGMVDDVMSRVAAKLGVVVPRWKLQRCVQVTYGTPAQVGAALGAKQKKGRSVAEFPAEAALITPVPHAPGGVAVCVRGIAPGGAPFDLFERVSVIPSLPKDSTSVALGRHTHAILAPPQPPLRTTAGLITKRSSGATTSFTTFSTTPATPILLRCDFRGHYAEPPLFIKVSPPATFSKAPTATSATFDIAYDPKDPEHRCWSIPSHSHPKASTAPTGRDGVRGGGGEGEEGDVGEAGGGGGGGKKVLTEKEMEEAHDTVMDLASELRALEM